MSSPKCSALFRLSVFHLALAASLTAYAQQGAAQPGEQEAKKKEAEKAVTLGTVVVQDQAVAPAPVENWRTLERSTDIDLKDVLSDQVAVQFGGGHGVAQWVTIRGLGQDQVDYVVDDAASDAQIFHHQGRFMLDPALVKVIGVEKGTGSASSGIGVTGGKVEATTVDAQDLLREGQNVGFRVNGGLQSNNDKGWRGGFSVYGRSGMVDGVAAFNRVSGDDYKDARDRLIGNSALDMRSFLAKVGVNFREDLRLTLSHRREEEYGVRNLREEFFFDTANDSPRYRHRTVDSSTVALTGRQLGFVDTLDVNASRIANEQETVDSALNLPSLVNIDTNVANVRLSSRIGTAHRIKYGVNLRQQEALPSSAAAAGLGSQKKTDSGLYVEGIWRWDPITLTTGLRYDRFSMTSNQGQKHSDGNLNPSVGLIWDATEQLSLRLSHNRASRSPRFYEALLASTPIRYGDSLKAERAQNTEIGFDWSAGGFAVSGSYFQQRIKDLQNFQGVNCRGRSCEYRLVTNRGELKNHGYELNAAYRWQALTARMGMAHSKPTLNGATVDSVATAIPMGRQWTTGLSYKIAPAHLELGWRGRYAQRGSYIDSTRGGGGTVNRAGYGVHDLYLSWQPLGNDTLFVNFTVRNVGNKQYRSHSQRSGISALPEAGRSFRLNVNYRF
ncbi:MAG: TonB-dependent receptor [Comamonadaceae bacterium]|nr:TonB-dependent receptor [Comamonadaceae bacterium]